MEEEMCWRFRNLGGKKIGVGGSDPKIPAPNPVSQVLW